MYLSPVDPNSYIFLHWFFFNNLFLLEITKLFLQFFFFAKVASCRRTVMRLAPVTQQPSDTNIVTVPLGDKDPVAQQVGDSILSPNGSMTGV